MGVIFEKEREIEQIHLLEEGRKVAGRRHHYVEGAFSHLLEHLVLAPKKIIQAEVGGEAMGISVDAFRQGLEVDLEHGVKFQDANVTNNHPILTGKIVLAHLKEMLDYYLRLEVAEFEGDILKALQAGNAEKVVYKYQQYQTAKAKLSASENDSLTNKG